VGSRVDGGSSRLPGKAKRQSVVLKSFDPGCSRRLHHASFGLHMGRSGYLPAALYRRTRCPGALLYWKPILSSDNWKPSLTRQVVWPQNNYSTTGQVYTPHTQESDLRYCQTDRSFLICVCVFIYVYVFLHFLQIYVPLFSFTSLISSYTNYIYRWNPLQVIDRFLSTCKHSMSSATIHRVTIQ
jgi:hypothetical protein